MSGSLPPLPPITDPDLVLSIFSADGDDQLGVPESEEHGAPTRLAQLGKRVLDQAIAFHYFTKTDPVLSAEQIDVAREVNVPNYAGLLHQYGLRNKIRCSQRYASDMETQQGAQHFFEKYLGAAFLLHGMTVIQEWVSRTIDPGSQPPPQPMSQARPNPATGFGYTQQPPPPAGPPPSQPPPPSYYSTGHTATPQPQPPTQPTYQILAQFNMAAQQHRLQATYPARSEGPSHSPLWHVQCCLNGEVRGEGSGLNQKQAKEMAARQAWVNMGWGNCKR